MPAGRTRVYEDERARKRAYYRRNQEKLKQKARDSYHARRKKQNEREAECSDGEEDADTRKDAEHDWIGKFYYLHRVKKVLGPEMAINTACDWNALIRALRKDLATWRGDFDDDQHCFREYTKLVINLARDGRPVSVIEEIMRYPFAVLKQIHAIADAAADMCLEAGDEGEDDPAGLYLSFANVGKDADLMECALREVMTLFRDSPNTLEDLFRDKQLMWFFL